MLSVQLLCSNVVTWFSVIRSISIKPSCSCYCDKACLPGLHTSKSAIWYHKPLYTDVNINLIGAKCVEHRDDLQEENLMRCLVEVEMPLVHVLERMEAIGIAVDPAIFAKHKVRMRFPPLQL